MSTQQIELPLQTKCSLCDMFYAQSQKPFIIYKCFCCLKLTPVCLSCELIMQRLLGKGNFFKCIHCNKLSSSLDKFEINPSSQQNSLHQRTLSSTSSFFKTPIKPFLDNNTLVNSVNQFISNEEKKDNSNICPTAISNFIKEFSSFDIGKNPNISNLGQMGNNSVNNNNLLNNSLFINKKNRRNITGTSNILNRTLTSSNSVNDIRKINDFSLLKTRRRINRRFCLNDSFLGRKRDDSQFKEELRGCNKSKDRVPSNNSNRNVFGTINPKRLITPRFYRNKNNENNTNTLTKCKFGLSSAINNYKFNGGFSNPLANSLNLNNLLINQNGIFGQGMNTISGTATPHKFFVNNNINNDEIYF